MTTKKHMKQNIFLHLNILFMLFGCNAKNPVEKNSLKKQHCTILTKLITTDDFKIIAKIECDDLSVEIINGKEKNKIKLLNAFGKLSFTSALPIVAYNGDKIHLVQYLFCNQEFLIFPFEDWNSNFIYYKIPLKKNSGSDRIHPLFILKEQFCLFNERSSIILTYRNDMREYFISNQSYYLTTLSLYDLCKNKNSDIIEFQTQKEINLPENASPTQVKQQLITAMSNFYDESIHNTYFK